MGRWASRSVLAECPTCWETCDAPSTSADAHRMWAQRHADRTGHTVFVQTDLTRAYEPRADR